jgi:hypothetical protein
VNLAAAQESEDPRAVIAEAILQKLDDLASAVEQLIDAGRIKRNLENLLIHFESQPKYTSSAIDSLSKYLMQNEINRLASEAETA